MIDGAHRHGDVKQNAAEVPKGLLERPGRETLRSFGRSRIHWATFLQAEPPDLNGIANFKHGGILWISVWNLNLFYMGLLFSIRALPDFPDMMK